AGLAIKAYYDFISMFPDDSLSPDFIFKSAEIATATQQYPQALQDYQTIENKYPNYKLYPESLFLQASLLDNFMNDDAKAKVVYQKVIDKFPASSYANDAKAAISNMGKSDEELHKEFMKKNKEK
ncbi:MAG: tetratricopeptide repeat protein, partial [Bacteroidia bacterium]